jgi:hypothetical protein
MENRFRVRFEVAETAGTPFSGQLELQYRRAGGAWLSVPVAPDDSTERAVAEVEVWNSTVYVSGDPTVDLLQGSATAFAGGVGLETNISAPITLDLQHAELEWTVKIRKFYETGVNTAGDVFEFRVVLAGGSPLGTYAAAASVTLVHPPGLIGGTYVENPGRLGPFLDSNGNLYYVAEPTEFDNRMMMLKSIDGGATWLEVDQIGHPATNDLEGVDIRQAGDVLHIAHHPGGEVVYHRFNMSGSATNPDNWVVVDEVIDSGFSQPDQAVTIELLSDGRITVFYAASAGSKDSYRYKTR